MVQMTGPETGPNGSYILGRNNDSDNEHDRVDCQCIWRFWQKYQKSQVQRATQLNTPLINIQNTTCARTLHTWLLSNTVLLRWISDQSNIRHRLDKTTEITARATAYNHYANNTNLKQSLSTCNVNLTNTSIDSVSCGGSSGFIEGIKDSSDTIFDKTPDQYGTCTNDSIDNGHYLEFIDEHRKQQDHCDQDCSTLRQPEYVNDSFDIQNYRRYFENPGESRDKQEHVPRNAISAVLTPDQMRSFTQELNNEFAKRLKTSRSELSLEAGRSKYRRGSTKCSVLLMMPRGSG